VQQNQDVSDGQMAEVIQKKSLGLLRDYLSKGKDPHKRAISIDA
jgi:hypothetical protein